MANSLDPDLTAPIGAVCSGSTLFASILNLSVMLGNYLQQTTSADDIFRCISFLVALRVNLWLMIPVSGARWLASIRWRGPQIQLMYTNSSYGTPMEPGRPLAQVWDKRIKIMSVFDKLPTFHAWLFLSVVHTWLATIIDGRDNLHLSQEMIQILLIFDTSLKTPQLLYSKKPCQWFWHIT